MAMAIWLVGRTGFVIGPLRTAGVMTGLLGLVLVYTALGGMLSVLVTDYLQFLVMGAGIVATSILVIGHIGWGNLIDGMQVAWAASAASGTPTMTGHPFNPLHDSSFGWGYVLWMFAFQIAVATTWQTQISRVLSARDADTAKRMYRRVSFYFVGRFLLPGLWGAAACVWYAQNGGLPEGTTSLTAMPHYLSMILPVGLIGLVVAAMLAAEMSTDSGYMLTWATVIYNDLITPCLRRPLEPRHRLLLTRLLVLAIAIFLLFYGLWYELPGNAWDYLAVTGNIYLASVFTLLVAGLYWPRATATGAGAALVLGAVGPITFLLLGRKFSIAPEIAGASSFALAFLGMIAGSLFGKAPARREPAVSAPRTP
jgi:SSS family solute:Na+ symporter